MFNHITIHVSQIERSRVFFEHALKPLGYRPYVVTNEKDLVGFEEGDKAGWCDVWIREDHVSTPLSVGCIAFTALSKQTVDDFYGAALRAGGRDNGAPGYREAYCPGYYAAYVLDPDGYSIEAIFNDTTRRMQS